MTKRKRGEAHLLGGIAGARDGVRGLLGGGLLARRLESAADGVGGALGLVGALLKGGLLGVGLQAGGGLVGCARVSARVLVGRGEQVLHCRLLVLWRKESDMFAVDVVV